MSTSPLLQCDHSESVGSGSTAGRLSTRFVHELEANGTRWAVAEWSKSIASHRQDGEEQEVRLSSFLRQTASSLVLLYERESNSEETPSERQRAVITF